MFDDTAEPTTATVEALATTRAIVISMVMVLEQGFKFSEPG